MKNRVKNFVKMKRAEYYRHREEEESGIILIGYVGCAHCDDAIPVFTTGLDIREDSDGDMALCAPLETSDLEAHRLKHMLDWSE